MDNKKEEDYGQELNDILKDICPAFFERHRLEDVEILKTAKKILDERIKRRSHV